MKIKRSLKIKPLFALTAFAASMSTFAQTVPPPAAAAHHEVGPRARLTSESRQALRKDIGEFHTGNPVRTLTSAPVVADHARSTADTLPHVREAPPLALPGAEHVTRRQQFEQRKHQNAERQDRADKREALHARKEARAHRRAARYARLRAAPDAGKGAVPPVSATSH
jgi:hypothetical protein